MHRDLEEQDFQRRLAIGVPRRRARELAVHRNAGDDVGAFAQRQSRRDVGDEVHRIELDQQVVAEEAVDVEAAGLGIELDPRAVLHGVGGDGEIGLHGEARIVAGQQSDGHARHVAQVGRDVAEGGMEAADRNDQHRAGAPADPQRHVAGEREADQMAVEQAGVEPDQPAVEIDAAGEIHLQRQQRQVLGRDVDAQHADDGDRRLRDIEDDAELERDQRRRAPAELAHRRRR